MPDVWRIYRIKNCRHTIPIKDKFAVIVCKETDYLAFLVNREIRQFLINRPAMLACQVKLKKADYGFLFQDSYLDCAQLYDFTDSELMTGLGLVTAKTKAEIKVAVKKATTIEQYLINLILDTP